MTRQRCYGQEGCTAASCMTPNYSQSCHFLTVRNIKLKLKKNKYIHPAPTGDTFIFCYMNQEKKCTWRVHIIYLEKQEKRISADDEKILQSLGLFDLLIIYTSEASIHTFILSCKKYASTIYINHIYIYVVFSEISRNKRAEKFKL